MSSCCAAATQAQDRPSPLPVPTEAARASEELDLRKEAETVTIATRHEQPISQAPSNVYVITDEDTRHSGATDIPAVLRRVPGLHIMQVIGAHFNLSAGTFDYCLSIGHDQNQQSHNSDALRFRSNKFNVQTQYNFSEDATLGIAGGFIDTNRFNGPVSIETGMTRRKSPSLCLMPAAIATRNLPCETHRQSCHRMAHPKALNCK